MDCNHASCGCWWIAFASVLSHFLAPPRLPPSTSLPPSSQSGNCSHSPVSLLLLLCQPVSQSESELDGFKSRKGPPINDVGKIFGFLDPLPCPHLQIICSTQPPLLSMHLSLSADILNGWSLRRRGREWRTNRPFEIQ